MLTNTPPDPWHRGTTDSEKPETIAKTIAKTIDASQPQRMSQRGRWVGRKAYFADRLNRRRTPSMDGIGRDITDVPAKILATFGGYFREGK